ncbi:MAG: GTP 3',8-cyclase MoaA [bacterium]
MNTLVDIWGRTHDAIRISVTDRCNLRCSYCMPEEGVEFVSRKEVLDYEELAFIASVAVKLGVTRVRLTGGEPLLRRDLDAFVRMLRLVGVEDIAMTTNGVLLEGHAERLAAAGLDRINVSMDSLRPDRFERITRWGILNQVWRGIEAAQDAGLGPIKINALLLEGFNTDEMDGWIELVKAREVSVRFMELMPVGDNALEGLGGFYNLTTLRETLQTEVGLAPASDVHVGNGPARYWKAPDWRGSFGFITPMSNPYCGSCRRLRLTCTGQLRACLAFDESIGLAEAARRRDEGAVAAAFQWAVAEKKFSHPWLEGQTTHTGMSAVGG